MSITEAIEECHRLAVEYVLAAGSHAGDSFQAQLEPGELARGRELISKCCYDQAHHRFLDSLRRLSDLPGGQAWAHRLQANANRHATDSTQLTIRHATEQIRGTA